MKSAPPVQVTVRRFGAWRVAVGSGMALAAAAVANWSMVLHADAALAGAWGRFAVIGSALLVLAGAATTMHRPATSLRWDAQRWHVGSADEVGHEPATGRLLVALDLGAFLLLRFQADGDRRVLWIPVQRSGLEAAWHALRCAVYSPRPAPGEPSALAASPRLSLPE